MCLKKHCVCLKIYAKSFLMFMIHLKHVNNLNIKCAHITFRCNMIFVIPQITFHLTSQQVLSSIYTYITWIWHRFSFQELYNKQVTGYDHHATMMNMKSYLSRFARFKNNPSLNKFISNTNILHIVYILSHRGRWLQSEVFV